MSNLTENYSRIARVMHLQAISFRIVSMKLNSQPQVDSIWNLPVEGSFSYCFCFSMLKFCYSSRIWKLLLPRAGRKSLQKKRCFPTYAWHSSLPSSQSAQSLSQVTKVTVVAVTSSSWRKKTLRECWKRETEVFS